MSEKWEARRAEKRARLEEERAERERIAKEEAARKAGEEAEKKAEEERLRQEQAAAEGEGEEGPEKEGGQEARDGQEGQDEETKDAEEEENVPSETEPKPVDSVEPHPLVEDLAAGPSLEEEDLNLDGDLPPPNEPETEEFKNLRTNFDRDHPQLLSVLKGTNNIDPIVVSVEKEVQAMNEEVLKTVEGTNHN